MKQSNWKKCLINDDSRNVLKRIPDNSIDLILTDPPYNLSKHSTGNIALPGRSVINNDIADWDKVDFSPEEWADEFIRILKPNGNLFIFTSYNQFGRWYDCLDRKFDTSNFMIWHKTNPAPKIFKAGFLNSCEMIFTCWNKGHIWNFISQEEMHNFFESPICMKPERLKDPKHPTQKPISILKKIITIATKDDDIIFDPFMGVGSTGVAAIEMNRKFIGIESKKEYYMAAKARINKTMSLHQDNSILMESSTEYTTSRIKDYSELNQCFSNYSDNKVKPTVRYPSALKPLLKWAGGKEKELKHIVPQLPKTYTNYFEPFVGGGAVFMYIDAKKYYINDLSNELIGLYRYIKDKDETFFAYAYEIDHSWENVDIFYESHTELKDVYIKFHNNELNKGELKQYITNFQKEHKFELIKILGNFERYNSIVFLNEVKKNLYRKMCRMYDLEQKKGYLPNGDIDDNLRTTFKSALYMFYRSLYNNMEIKSHDAHLSIALFFFIRNYSYSGMFRYNSKGEFNVPYGGIAYNKKSVKAKLKYYKQHDLQQHFANTLIDNMDFEQFLLKHKPTKNDFIFLDPPYDSEFSTYAQNKFGKEEQKRLAEYLILKCKAKWMMVIKNTDFIYHLYNKKGIKINAFDKKYQVSFMNRNNKNVQHLMITNY